MQLFGSIHLSTLAVIFLTGAFLIAMQRKGNRWPLGLLAFLNIISYSYNQAVYNSFDYQIQLDNLLPLHLCDLAAFLAGLALITRHALDRHYCNFSSCCFGLEAETWYFTKSPYLESNLLRNRSRCELHLSNQLWLPFKKALGPITFRPTRRVANLLNLAPINRCSLNGIAPFTLF